MTRTWSAVPLTSIVRVWLAVAAALLAAAPAFAADFPVANEAALRAALHPATGAQDDDTITFTAATITLLADLPAVQRNVTIRGQGNTLDGAGQFRGFFVGKFSGSTQVAVTVTIQDLTIQNAKAAGGNGGANPLNQGGGGGGGAGLGAAVFVADLANVTLTDVVLSTNDARGGTGGPTPGGGDTGAGGGGMGGAGGNGSALRGGGGGGLGVGASGGTIGSGGSSGIATGASSGGQGGNGGGAGGPDGGAAAAESSLSRLAGPAVAVELGVALAGSPLAAREPSEVGEAARSSTTWAARAASGVAAGVP
jgi:hypothetical protein